MDTAERTMARLFFKSKIQSLDGMAFQGFANQILGYAEKDFIPIKPWGNIGDRKNDGCVPSKGIYYQIYAPEDFERSYKRTIDKIQCDFTGLLDHYTDSAVRKYYFVVNDRYRGIHPDLPLLLEEIRQKYGLEEARVLCAKDLENTLFGLSDDEILAVVGQLPDPSKIPRLDYSILNEVIAHIMEQPIQSSDASRLVVPDWEEKIAFNGLSRRVAGLLDSGMMYIGSLEEYLKNNDDHLAHVLRDHLHDVYYDESKRVAGDELFYALLNRLCPMQQLMFQNTVLVIMAKYFETCDIFEEPNKGKEQ
ncbi:MAG: hypothetical protein RBQ65_00250 [Sphaerochaeta sp.]|nr:hypothetical protein [Sphaerochaeta sp.]